jgi:hypothetical protein
MQPHGSHHYCYRAWRAPSSVSCPTYYLEACEPAAAAPDGRYPGWQSSVSAERRISSAAICGRLCQPGPGSESALDSSRLGPTRLANRVRWCGFHSCNRVQDQLSLPAWHHSMQWHSRLVGITPRLTSLRLEAAVYNGGGDDVIRSISSLVRLAELHVSNMEVPSAAMAAALQPLHRLQALVST